MTYGAIDFIAVGFKDSNFNSEIAANLLELVEQGIVRIIDLLVVVKDSNGEVSALEIEQIDAATLAVFEPLKDGFTGMATQQDIELVGQMLENDSRAAIVMFENLWAVKLKEAILRGGGRLLMHERIPDEVVLELVEEMAALDEGSN